MAGTIVVTQTSNMRGRTREKFREFLITSDSADGSVPDQDMFSLDDCELREYMYAPDSVATPANTFDIIIVEKANPTRIVWQSGEDGGAGIAADAFKRDMTIYTGAYAQIDGPVTVKFVSPADHSAACNIGNSKISTLKFRLVKKS